MKPLLVVVSGPTPVGKTALSVHIAQTLNCPVISGDSRQFYRELCIGTAKPSMDELGKVKHFFIGHLSVNDYYNISRFEQDVIRLFNENIIDTPIALLTGGSGLYTDAVCKGVDDIPDPDPDLRSQMLRDYEEKGAEHFRSLLKKSDPETYAKIDLKNKNRLIRAIETILTTGKTLGEIRKGNFAERPFRVLKIALDIPRAELYTRINDRVVLMIEKGLEPEARGLHTLSHLNALNTVGYKEFFEYFDGKISLDEAIEKIKASTRKYARRQLTWLRRDKEYHWFHPNQPDEIVDLINRSL